ncbi:hypothetical protein HPP92_008869 [Vanilla planifolia]|uniref:Uncharacterized protein n=1 Tax=Vanilla planifolia TaxID=51239 RepID=A0A835R3F6_VANPL|nr:hypothetical protein HPP92_008869 [Vanilla planifolia]
MMSMATRGPCPSKALKVVQERACNRHAVGGRQVGFSPPGQDLETDTVGVGGGATRQGGGMVVMMDSSGEDDATTEDVIVGCGKKRRWMQEAGYILGITSVSLLPVETVADLSPTFFRGLIKALVSAVCMNIYVVGLNQIFDIKIDKVNKPFLPLASGELSVAAGVTIVLSFCVISFLVGAWSQSPPLLFALLVSFLLGTAYSLDAPLLRWKQHAFLAASCILTVRAILVQLAFFLHMQKHVLGRQRNLTKPVVFATVFMCFFSAVIALFKEPSSSFEVM